MSTVLVLVHGTWGAAWAEPHSPFRELLAREGCVVTDPSFEWSGDISGIPSLTANGKHSDWRAGAAALSYYLRGVDYAHRNLIAHSHGGQVVAYAAAVYGVTIRRLVTVSTPVRADMAAYWQRATPRIGYHAHVAAKRGDWTAWLGRLFDGDVQWCSWSRRLPTADLNVMISGIGHSGVLKDPKHLELWRRERLLEIIRAEDDAIGARRVDLAV